MAKVRSLTGNVRRSASLSELRKAHEMTQVQVAKRLRSSQGVVSRLECQEDMYVSSLAMYVEALGGHLELRARFQKGQSYALKLGGSTDRRQK